MPGARREYRSRRGNGRLRADGVNTAVNREDPVVRDQIRQLRELITALDQRVPHIERIGEADIASDAAALKQRALDRIRELER
jgi:hypothetical protein